MRLQVHGFAQLIRHRFPRAALLLVLLSLRAVPAAAQQASPPSQTRPAADSLRQIAREDTTYALQRLFHENRRRYAIQAVVRGAALGYFTYSTRRAFQPSGTMEQKVVNVLMVSACGYFFASSTINRYRYRTGREKRILAAFEQGHPIPANVRKKFTPSYFDTPITSN